MAVKIITNLVRNDENVGKGIPSKLCILIDNLEECLYFLDK